MNPSSVPHNHVAIIGTGFGGIATAVRLQKAGFDDLVLLDRAGDVGGVWRDNDYPGAAVDVKSHLYSFSFAQNPDWRNAFAKQPELHAYLRRVADQFDLRRRLVLDCEVEELRWDPVEQLWMPGHVARPADRATRRGRNRRARRTGNPGPARAWSASRAPSFTPRAGTTRFDLTGKRVAVIGTGASAVQFVPAIQPTVGQMTVFQRTPPWIMPRHDHAIAGRRRRLLRAVPVAAAARTLRIYLQCEWMVIGFRNPPADAASPSGQRASISRLRSRTPSSAPSCCPTTASAASASCSRTTTCRPLTQPNVELVTDGDPRDP